MISDVYDYSILVFVKINETLCNYYKKSPG